MKLTIRFADQIVGALIILALGILVFLIFMLGSSQRWFSRDYNFRTYFNSASGLSQNMAVQYKGFTIGHVKSIKLADDDRVEVQFTVFDTYIDRVRTGSLVEVLESPIGNLLGNQFLFYPGLGDELIPEGETIPSANSSEGKRLLAMGLARRPETTDDISVIMHRVGTLLETFNEIAAEVQEAFEGSDRTSLGRTFGELESAIVNQINPILVNLNSLTGGLADPDGTIMAILDSDGDVYGGLASSLDSLAGILNNLNKTSEFIPSEVRATLADLHTALMMVQDILVSVSNNPLLKGGIPERTETRAGGAHVRDVEF